jgi:hypothetical protein
LGLKRHKFRFTATLSTPFINRSQWLLLKRRIRASFWLRHKQQFPFGSEDSLRKIGSIYSKTVVIGYFSRFIKRLYRRRRPCTNKV